MNPPPTVDASSNLQPNYVNNNDQRNKLRKETQHTSYFYFIVEGFVLNLKVSMIPTYFANHMIPISIQESYLSQ